MYVFVFPLIMQLAEKRFNEYKPILEEVRFSLVSYIRLNGSDVMPVLTTKKCRTRPYVDPLDRVRRVVIVGSVLLSSSTCPYKPGRPTPGELCARPNRCPPSYRRPASCVLRPASTCRTPSFWISSTSYQRYAYLIAISSNTISCVSSMRSLKYVYKDDLTIRHNLCTSSVLRMVVPLRY